MPSANNKSWWHFLPNIEIHYQINAGIHEFHILSVCRCVGGSVPPPRWTNRSSPKRPWTGRHGGSAVEATDAIGRSDMAASKATTLWDLSYSPTLQPRRIELASLLQKIASAGCNTEVAISFSKISKWCTSRLGVLNQPQRSSCKFAGGKRSGGRYPFLWSDAAELVLHRLCLDALSEILSPAAANDAKLCSDPRMALAAHHDRHQFTLIATSLTGVTTHERSSDLPIQAAGIYAWLQH